MSRVRRLPLQEFSLEPKFDIKKGDFYVVENLLLLEFALALLIADARAKGMGVRKIKGQDAGESSFESREGC